MDGIYDDGYNDSLQDQIDDLNLKESPKFSMKRENNELQTIELIKNLIEFQVKSMCETINFAFQKQVFNSFWILTKNLTSSKINVMKTTLIFENLKSKIITLFHIYSKFRYLVKQKSFLKFKRHTILRIKMSKLKFEVEKSLEKKKDRRLNSLERKLKEKEVELTEINKNHQNIVENLSESSRKLKQEEETFANLQSNLKKIESEKKTIEDESKKFEKFNIESLQYRVSLETKIKEYESEIEGLGYQNEEKENVLSSFIHEMNEMLEAHEKINNEILGEQENKESSSIHTNKNPVEGKENSNSVKPLQKSSFKSSINSSGNLAFNIINNNQVSTSHQSNNKNSLSNFQSSKGFFINSNNVSTPSANKSNLQFNKQNLSNNSINNFKSKNI